MNVFFPRIKSYKKKELAKSNDFEWLILWSDEKIGKIIFLNFSVVKFSLGKGRGVSIAKLFNAEGTRTCGKQLSVGLNLRRNSDVIVLT